MPVPILNLTRQYQELEPQLMDGLLKIIRSSHFIMGEDLQKFETEVAQSLGVKHAIGVTSGTDALLVALRALGIGPGARVLTSPFTFFATISAICQTGATPVFADIDPKTLNVDPQSIKRALENDKDRSIRAILPVHIYGQSCDIESIVSLAEARNIAVVEDAAQAIGAKYKNRSVGTFGSFGCFSFFPTKNLGALGDAGLLTTNSDALATTARKIRTHGSTKKYHHEILGGNYRMDTLQAAALRIFLPKLPQWLAQRNALADRYDQAFKECKPWVLIPERGTDRNHTFHQYTLRIPGGRRNEFQTYLDQHQIASCVYYPIPCHLQAAVADLGYKRGEFPKSEKACDEVISLPIFPAMTVSEQDEVIQTIFNWVRKESSK